MAAGGGRPRPRGPAARRGRLAAAALVLAAIFHLWDGRTLEVREYLQHGDEYVVTLPDGSMRIVRQAEVREVVAGARPAAGPARPPGPPAAPGGAIRAPGR
jgi:hypothetical protein